VILVFSINPYNARSYDIFIGRTAYHLPYKGRVVEEGGEMGFTKIFDTEVPDNALHLLWSLENRGVQIRIDHDALIMTPTSKIPDSDRRLIKKYRAHIMHLVRGCEELIQREDIQGGYQPPTLREGPSVRSSAPGQPPRRVRS
jgi:hypothetical protein